MEKDAIFGDVGQSFTYCRWGSSCYKRLLLGEPRFDDHHAKLWGAACARWGPREDAKRHLSGVEESISPKSTIYHHNRRVVFAEVDSGSTMLANELLVSPSFYVLVIAACITLSLFQAARNKWANGLNSIPGPALAAYTGWWRVLSVLQRRPELAHVALHTRYGPLVRLGPRVVSVSDPNAIKVIYGLNAGYVKASAFRSDPPIVLG